MANPDHVAKLRAAAATAALDFTGFDLAGALLPSIRLDGASLRSANLRKADLSGAYLRRADFSAADLTQARLVMADLREAKLASAKLKSADLSSAVLAGADLREADLSGCRLTRADLTGCDLTGARLAKADLRGARGLTVEQVSAARGWETAVVDPPTANALGLAQPVATGRHGAKPPAPPRQRRGASFVVDIAFGDRRPTFGDLYLLCDNGPHPQFAPSGACDLSGLGLGFTQADDFFAIRGNGREVAWLYPLVRGLEAPHHPGPFDAVRLEWTRPAAAATDQFLSVALALSQACGGTFRAVDGEGQPGSPMTPEELRAAVVNITATP